MTHAWISLGHLHRGMARLVSISLQNVPEE